VLVMFGTAPITDRSATKRPVRLSAFSADVFCELCGLKALVAKGCEEPNSPRRSLKLP
jgi:hypothetical protein